MVSYLNFSRCSTCNILGYFHRYPGNNFEFNASIYGEFER